MVPPEINPDVACEIAIARQATDAAVQTRQGVRIAWPQPSPSLTTATLLLPRQDDERRRRVLLARAERVGEGEPAERGNHYNLHPLIRNSP